MLQNLPADSFTVNLADSTLEIAGLPSDRDLEREETEWLGSLQGTSSKSQSAAKKASGNKGRRNSSQFQNAATKQTPAVPHSTTSTKAANKIAESSPDVSEDESAMSALNHMQSGGAPTSDLYHKYRYSLYPRLCPGQDMLGIVYIEFSVLFKAALKMGAILLKPDLLSMHRLAKLGHEPLDYRDIKLGMK